MFIKWENITIISIMIRFVYMTTNPGMYICYNQYIYVTWGHDDNVNSWVLFLMLVSKQTLSKLLKKREQNQKTHRTYENSVSDLPHGKSATPVPTTCWTKPYIIKRARKKNCSTQNCLKIVCLIFIFDLFNSGWNRPVGECSRDTKAQDYVLT